SRVRIDKFLTEEQAAVLREFSDGENTPAYFQNFIEVLLMTSKYNFNVMQVDRGQPKRNTYIVFQYLFLNTDKTREQIAQEYKMTGSNIGELINHFRDRFT